MATIRSLAQENELDRTVSEATFGLVRLRLQEKTGPQTPEQLILELQAGLPGTLSVTAVGDLEAYGLRKKVPSFLVDHQQFDARYLIVADEIEISRQAFANTEVRRLILAVMAFGVQQLSIANGKLRASWEKIPENLPKDLVPCARKLASLGSAFQPWFNSSSEGELERLRRLRIRLSRCSTGLMFGAWILLAIVATRHPLLNSNGFSRYCVSFCLVAILVYCFFVWRVLRSAGGTLKDMLVLGPICGLMWVSGSLPCALFMVNVFCDQSEPQTIHLNLAEKIEESGRDREVATILDFLAQEFPAHENWFKEWRLTYNRIDGPPPMEKLSLRVDRVIYDRAAVGQKVALQIKTGRLGFEWLILPEKMK